jgi:hypothetical protein
LSFQQKQKLILKIPTLNFKDLVQNKNLNKQHKNIWVPFVCVKCLIASLFIYKLHHRLNVYAGKDIVARTSSQQKFKSYIEDFDKKLSEELQVPFETSFNFYYEFSLVPKSKLDKFDDFGVYLLKNNHEIEKMYVLKVNDKVVAANLDGPS